jgi:hypothetical protein
MCVLSFGDASGVLANAKCAMRCRAPALRDFYFLIVGALPEGDLKIQFLRCSEPGTAFGTKDLTSGGIQYLLSPLCNNLETSSDFFDGPLRCRV